MEELIGTTKYPTLYVKCRITNDTETVFDCTYRSKWVEIIKKNALASDHSKVE